MPTVQVTEISQEFAPGKHRPKVAPFFTLVSFSGKGVGRVRIEPQANTTVDIFVTHTIADSGTTMANNTWYRVKQVEELMESYVKKSTADVIILGGDFNTPPKMDVGQPYEIIQRFMKNSAEEIFAKLKEWLMPKFATYGNQRNSFSYMYEPITYDYIFHKGWVARLRDFWNSLTHFGW